MEENKLIEGISFPQKFLQIYLNKAYSVDISGNGSWDEYGILEIYDEEKKCNHSTTIYTESDIYDGDIEDNIASCLDYMRSNKIFRPGINYEVYFGDDENDKPLRVKVTSDGDIV